MLSSADYIRESLDLHLFFARIMKEHSFFLEIGFTPKNGNFTENADEFRMAFDDFLKDVIELSNDVVGADYLASGQVITPVYAESGGSLSLLHRSGHQYPADGFGKKPDSGRTGFRF